MEHVSEQEFTQPSTFSAAVYINKQNISCYWYTRVLICLAGEIFYNSLRDVGIENKKEKERVYVTRILFGAKVGTQGGSAAKFAEVVGVFQSVWRGSGEDTFFQAFGSAFKKISFRYHTRNETKCIACLEWSSRLPNNKP